MDVLTAIHSRRAVRDYRDEPVAADAIAALSLGSCWIGLSEAWLNTDAGKAALGIPPALRPVAPIIVGHPKGPLPATTRRLADVRHVETVSRS